VAPVIVVFLALWRAVAIAARLKSSVARGRFEGAIDGPIEGRIEGVCAAM
jgi:hypothetical protein